MLPMMKVLGPAMGMAGPVTAGAQRYIDAAKLDRQDSGKFFASPPKKLVGELQEQRTALIRDEQKRSAAYAFIVQSTGGLDVHMN